MSFDPSTLDALSLSSPQDFSGGTSGSGTTTNIGGLLGAAGSLLGAGGSFIAGQSSAAADTASAKGYEEESQAYTEAAGYAQGNVSLAEEATKIQQYQQQRALAKSLGATRAEEASAGFGPGGSGLDILRESMSQGALATGLIGVQGSINAQGYAAQSTADTALAAEASGASNAATAAASSASSSGFLGAAGSALGAIGSIAKLFL